MDSNCVKFYVGPRGSMRLLRESACAKAIVLLRMHGNTTGGDNPRRILHILRQVLCHAKERPREWKIPPRAAVSSIFCVLPFALHVDVHDVYMLAENQDKH